MNLYEKLDFELGSRKLVFVFGQEGCEVKAPMRGMRLEGLGLFAPWPRGAFAAWWHLTYNSLYQ